MSTQGYFFKPVLNCYVMSPLVMTVTCKSWIWTNALPCFAGAHAGTLTLALEHHKAEPKSLYTQMGACVSQPHSNACDGNRLDSRTFACNPDCVKSLQTKHSDFLLCLWSFYCHCRVRPQFWMLVSLGVWIPGLQPTAHKLCIYLL